MTEEKVKERELAAESAARIVAELFLQVQDETTVSVTMRERECEFRLERPGAVWKSLRHIIAWLYLVPQTFDESVWAEEIMVKWKRDCD